jgi:hypothetical protein
MMKFVPLKSSFFHKMKTDLKETFPKTFLSFMSSGASTKQHKSVHMRKTRVSRRTWILCATNNDWYQLAESGGSRHI